MKSRAGSAKTIFFTRNSENGTLVVGTLLGANGEFVTGDGVIARLHFRSLIDDVHQNISLLNTKIANSEAEISRLGDVVQVPDDYRLQQNYPNPFNPETKIRFELPKNTHVTLKIFNVLGQQVATLINSDMKSGYHLVKWDGKNQFGIRVASGVYYYRLETTEFSRSMRMLLIK